MIKHWIAFSGGIDSLVLLHFLAKNFGGLSLHAIHINHQLQQDAKSWEKHCRHICKLLNIPLKIVRVSISQKKGESLEALARQKRYEVFDQFIKKNDILLTAHHLDDQAETVLLQLFRGAGLKGVSAMPNISSFGKGYLVRPFLRFSREDLLHYAKQHQLDWIDDPSNVDQRFDRNFLRQSVMPILKNRWPQIHKVLARFAKHAHEQEKIIQALASLDYKNCQGEYVNTLYIPAVVKLDCTRQHNVLRYFLQALKLPSPPEKLLLELQQSLFKAKSDANPLVHWNNIYFKRYRKHLFIEGFSKGHSHETLND